MSIGAKSQVVLVKLRLSTPQSPRFSQNHGMRQFC
ncbi:hypothetical protein L916_06818 [Phytophthora nicotianae]|uniref:Uncharacterized protein n=1 Tax=Phytophthora nicotianae TaxID=4792 RepID=W2J7D5_PHYNI|nr:hypothetical protein L916_06818 [Phytophthora nicotianae]